MNHLPHPMHFSSMFSGFVCVSRSLAICNLNLNKSYSFPAISTSSQARTQLFVRRMASQGNQFPPQKQEAQPGIEHLMDPNPMATSHEYKPANKLQV